MALHSELEIYRTCYDLLGVAVEVIRQMRRDIKKAVGDQITQACVDLPLLVRRANIAADKEPHLLQFLERVEAIELLVRTCRDHHWISTGHYAAIVHLTQSVGRQANAWRTRMKELAGSHQRQLFGPQGG